MKIAVNTRFLLNKGAGGFGKFTYETFRRITSNHPETEFYFFFDRSFSKEFVFSKNVHPVIVNPPARHPLLWYVWYEWSVPSALKKVKADLFISPDGCIPLNGKVKTVSVIHDLNFEHHPEFVPYAERVFYRRLYPRYAQKSDRIVTVSEYSKKDITETYKISPGKIDVAYDGSGSEFIPLSDEKQKQVRNTYSQGKEYFVFVGGLYPRKNIRNLLLAFDLFKKQTGSDFLLVLVGPRIPWGNDWENEYKRMEFQNHVCFIPRLEPSDLAQLYGAAYALVFPSFFEGFGIPIAEAMNCDTAIITSDSSSMPEVGGEAALYLDPFSVTSISDAMVKLYHDRDLREQLIENGKIQRLKFSWDNTARVVWEAVEKVTKGQNEWENKRQND